MQVHIEETRAKGGVHTIAVKDVTKEATAAHSVMNATIADPAVAVARPDGDATMADSLTAAAATEAAQVLSGGGASPKTGSGQVALPPPDAGTPGLTARAMAVIEKSRSAEKVKEKDGKGGGEGKGKNGSETKEVKQMLKTMILGVKTVVWSVSNSRMTVQPPHPVSGAVVGGMHTLHKGMSEAECLLVARLLNSGLACFAIYNQGPDTSPQEEKDVLDYFAGVFTVLDVRNFTHVFLMQMEFLYARVLANNTMSTMLQHFLANSTVSRAFADILLTFLVGRIDQLGKGAARRDTHQSRPR